MATPNYNLPTISGNMAADVVRDMNALADATDGAIKTVDTKLSQHTSDVTANTKWLGIVGGTANALTANFDGLTSYKDGMGISFVAKSDSTGAVTIIINGLGAIPLKKSSGTAVSNLKAGGVYTLRYSGTAFFLQGESGGDPVANGTQTFSTPGTYSFTVPEGVTRIFYRMWGAGGGGGGSSANRPSVGGGGGGAGAYVSGFLNVNPNSNIAVTVGAGGGGGLPNENSSSSAVLLGGGGGSSYITGTPFIAGGGGGGASVSTDGVARGGSGGSNSNGSNGLIDITSYPPKQGSPNDLSGTTSQNYISSFISGTSGTYSNGDYGAGGGGGCSDAFAGNLPNGTLGGPEQTIRNFIKGSPGGRGDSSAGSNGSGGGGSNSYNNGASNKPGGKGGDGKVILYW